ncbi:MAG TPA: hypothetical protein VIY52_18985 [Streptosporangiaceae bacterium]
MKRRSRASPVVKIACLARSALPDERYAGDRHSCGRTGTFASGFGPGRAAAAVSAR